MGKVTIIDNLAKFGTEMVKGLDRALNLMAIDIERLSKAQVPLKTGQLRSSGYHRKRGTLDYVVVYNKEYARYQEFGGDGKRKVRNYSKPGTKPFYLRDPGRLVANNSLKYIEQEATRVKI
jgi:hypothetical protein